MIPVRSSLNFTLLRRNDGHWQIRCVAPNCIPKVVRVSESDARYLRGLNSDFDHACVWDFGCGVFRSDEPETTSDTVTQW